MASNIPIDNEQMPGQFTETNADRAAPSYHSNERETDAESQAPHHVIDADSSAKALESAVDASQTEDDVQDHIHEHPDVDLAHAATTSSTTSTGGRGKKIKTHVHALFKRLVPNAQKVAVQLHTGNYVAIRDKTKLPGTERFFESMPIYARIGMHLLFYGKEQVKLLEGGKVENVLKTQSLKQGKIYDGPASVKNIPSFIKTYKIDTAELLEPDISKYANFNEFFFRKLKAGARPVENNSPNAFCCAADCRLAVYHNVEDAQKFWIKGDEFTIKSLLFGKEEPDNVFPLLDASLAIFRLAPADYHRFHSPIDGTIVTDPKVIPGTYYTVNPQAVNEVNFDVFTANKRAIIYIKHEATGHLVAFVAVGALLVGSIGWTKKTGDKVAKGDELGYFAYGGSTVITVFPVGLIRFDEDLTVNSKNALETLVKVGWTLGETPAPA